MYWRRRLTRLELALYASAAAIVIAAFLERGLYYMELAERTAMEVTVSQVNSGINLRRAQDMLIGGRPSNPTGENPFRFARVVPPNFRGEASAGDLQALERGGWAFDPDSREVVYLPRLRRLLEVSDPDGLIRFRMGPERGFMLVPTSEYRWGW